MSAMLFICCQINVNLDLINCEMGHSIIVIILVHVLIRLDFGLFYCRKTTVVESRSWAIATTVCLD